MPVFLRINGYKIYFWSNENNEPIHFHITIGDPSENDTKIWIKKDGGLQIAHNKGRVSERDLFRIITTMSSYVSEYEKLWNQFFGSIKYYC